MLIDFVHRHGGVLGPAHPCGEKYMSFTNTKRFYKNPEIISDLILSKFSMLVSRLSRMRKAAKLAYKYQKVGIGEMMHTGRTVSVWRIRIYRSV